MISKHQKPPIGVTPRKIWLMERKDELFAAMERYHEVYMKIPREWVYEYNDIVDELFYEYSNPIESVSSQVKHKEKTLCDSCALQDFNCKCNCSDDFIRKDIVLTPDQINYLVDLAKKRGEIDE